MEKIFEIKKLNVPGIFEDFSLEVEKGWTFILGPSGSGKSLIVNNCAKIYRHSCQIFIDQVELNDATKRSIYSKIGILFENPDNLFFSETVYDEIAFSLTNIGISKKDIKEEITKMATSFGINDLLKRSPRSLSGSEKQLVALVAALAKNPILLIADDAFSRMMKSEKEEILKYLKKLNISLIYLSSDAACSEYFENLIVINDGKIIMNDKRDIVYNDDKLFSTLGVSLPFMADLSHKLRFYDLIDEFIFDMKEMVNKLWK